MNFHIMKLPSLLAATDPEGFQDAALFMLGLYLCLLLVLGALGFIKSRNTEEDYYLAGRNQGWIVSALTIMATFFSSFAFAPLAPPSAPSCFWSI